MTRSNSYQLEEVFERAIPIVLEHGYKGCSMEVLINKTDFNRRAFYLEFKSKEAFMLALLQFYIERYLLPLESRLRAKNQIQDAILDYFKSYQSQINQQGCLLVRLILEMGKHNTDIQSQARHFYDNLQLAFIGCIEKAIAHQELPTNTNAEALALKLCCISQGMAVSNNIQQGDSDAFLVIKSLFANEIP